ncbi:MAG: pyridoxamine kinase [Bacteroidetes bacterium]|nr:pyridoxamine kinase [Bacteroidota bacterium]
MDTPQTRIVPRVAAIHDLSGFGRSSLTVVLPILSSMGIQVCPLPTALLSTQTSGFDDYYFLDLTESMKEIISHWDLLGIQFNSVYSGFLGSADQIIIVSDFIESCRKNTHGVKPLILVDPVLGDDGEPYGPVSKEMIDGMSELVKKADVITPNYTEAALLLNKPVKPELQIGEIKEYLMELADLGPQKVVITSIPAQGRERFSSVYAYDKSVHTFWKVECEYLPASYPGTGDMFASMIVGSLLKGGVFPEAVDQAVQFVYKAIRETYLRHIPVREGVLIESILDTLAIPMYSNTYEVVD